MRVFPNSVDCKLGGSCILDAELRKVQEHMEKNGSDWAVD